MITRSTSGSNGLASEPWTGDGLGIRARSRPAEMRMAVIACRPSCDKSYLRTQAESSSRYVSTTASAETGLSSTRREC